MNQMHEKTSEKPIRSNTNPSESIHSKTFEIIQILRSQIILKLLKRFNMLYSVQTTKFSLIGRNEIYSNIYSIAQFHIVSDTKYHKWCSCIPRHIIVVRYDCWVWSDTTIARRWGIVKLIIEAVKKTLTSLRHGLKEPITSGRGAVTSRPSQLIGECNKALN